jgi:hypothetical protein
MGINKMAKRLPVPSELEYLIEKRERERDRRTGDRRAANNARSAAGNQERRRQADRRKKRRRKGDSK